MKLQLNWIKWSANGRGRVGILKGPACICESSTCRSRMRLHSQGASTFIPHSASYAMCIHIYFMFGNGSLVKSVLAPANRVTIVYIPIGLLVLFMVAVVFFLFFFLFCSLSVFMVSFFRLSGGSKQKNLSRRRIYWWGEGVLFIPLFFLFAHSLYFF